ncbi:CDP-alcohol phosphatidyltransferase family protein [Zavarzinia sp. CC-PAN008]|uniref:CDP-alcohol phosphatidyltransferase family protein n=1 Tax=Zavarzinia sp. CC-PAN008 TaxID=3243332 RepID=UPI003F74838E
MNVPNLISLGRLLAVPVTLWLILEQHYGAAFCVFAAAAVSDAVDGYIARTFHAQTPLGFYLDPAADKALLVTTILALASQGLIPLWLVAVTVGRDLLIVMAILSALWLAQPMAMQPNLLGKASTLAQALLLGALLAALALPQQALLSAAVPWLIMLVACITAASGLSYLWRWIALIRVTGGARP